MKQIPEITHVERMDLGGRECFKIYYTPAHRTYTNYFYVRAIDELDALIKAQQQLRWKPNNVS